MQEMSSLYCQKRVENGYNQRLKTDFDIKCFKPSAIILYLLINIILEITIYTQSISENLFLSHVSLRLQISRVY